MDRLPRIFFSSRTRHAGRWRAMRAAWADKFQVVSTWIDEAGAGESPDLADLSKRCINEAAAADAVIVYVEPGDLPLKGALMEVGAALASGKQVYWCGPPADTALMEHRLISKYHSIHEAIATAISYSRALPDEPDSPLTEIVKLRSRLEFLRDKGITVGLIKTSDRPEPYLAYEIRRGSELDDTPAITAELDAQREIRKLKAELEQLRKAPR